MLITMPSNTWPQTTIPQWNPATAQAWMNPAAAQSWGNPMMSQWNAGQWQSGSNFQSPANQNNQDFRVSSSVARSFSGLGKLRILNVFFSGLRNTGLEETIAGEIIQRLIKALLKDIVVPWKKQLFQFR
ncbi:hypothetical protein HNY73_015904 [Argiope bruennichi]|uniref:Uncharacterized protein n=1 Tax=Argiope bruennichi TaxID=94029 RepID=A0A8T0EKI8_ARGBR|nr:hypothetical protein HNY73_015904 [Argiope bruennichi]